jgi:hypothetical protein
MISKIVGVWAEKMVLAAALKHMMDAWSCGG